MTDDADCITQPEAERPPWVTQLMANTRKRWQLIQDLAATEPYSRVYGRACNHCFRYVGKGHTDNCIWARARRLVDEAADRP
jgi:hypothetical protein